MATDFSKKKSAELAFNNLLDAQWGAFSRAFMSDPQYNGQSGMGAEWSRLISDPASLAKWLKEDPGTGDIIAQKFGMSRDSLIKIATLKSDFGARRDFLSKYDPSSFKDSSEWRSAMADELGQSFLQNTYNGKLFEDLDKSGVFGDQGKSEDAQKVAKYEADMQQFIDELKKPLDRNNPQVQNLIRTVNTGQLRRQQEMGLGGGGYSAANSERAAMGALTPLQAQRQGMAIDLTGQLANSAQARENNAASLDLQNRQLDIQKMNADRAFSEAQNQAGYSSGQGVSRAIGAGVGGGVGTAIGAGLGALLAPFTGGASIALGAGLGGSVGGSLGGGIGGAAFGPYRPSQGLGGGASNSYYGYKRGSSGGFYGGSGT